MSNDTTFLTHAAPTIDAPWLNDINDHVFHDTPVVGTTVHAASVITNTPAGNIVSTNVQNAINELNTERVAASAALATSSGATLVGWVQSGIGAVLRLLQDKVRESVSVKDYGVLGNGTDETVNIN